MPRRYQQFAPAYRRLRDLYTASLCDGRETAQLADDPLGQMLLFTTIVHERAGRSPAYALYHRQALMRALRQSDAGYSECVTQDASFGGRVWDAFVDLCKESGTGVNETHTSGPVLESVELLRESGTAQWIEFLKGREPEEAWEALRGLRGIGPKLASFVLREFQAFLSVWGSVERNAWYCFQPLDRWVLRAAHLLWKDLELPEKAPQDAKRYRRATQSICEQFAWLDDAMDFNMGAWFVSAHRDQVLSFHGHFYVGDWDRETEQHLHDTLERFDAEAIAAAVTWKVAREATGGAKRNA